MPAKLKEVKPGDEISAKTFNEVIERVNALSTMRGDGAIVVKHGDQGLVISSASHPRRREFQITEDTPPDQNYVTCKEMKWVNGAWELVNEDEVFYAYDVSQGAKMAKYTKVGYQGTAAWDGAHGIWVIMRCDHVARIIVVAPTTPLLEGMQQATCALIGGEGPLSPLPLGNRSYKVNPSFTNGLQPTGPITLLNAPDMAYEGAIVGLAGFSDTPTVTITSSRPSTPAIALACTDTSCTQGSNDACSIASLELISPGANYAAAPTFSVPHGAGDVPGAPSAYGTTTIANGKVTSMTLQSGGSGYSAGYWTNGVFNVIVQLPIPGLPFAVAGTATLDPSCVVNCDGTKAANAVCSIQSVTFAPVGQDIRSAVFSSPPTPLVQTIPAPPGVAAVVTATLDANGHINGIQLQSGGSGYPPRTPQARYNVQFTPEPGIGGSGAEAEAELGCGGTVATINVTKPGSGYKSTDTFTVTLKGDGAFGCAYQTSPGVWTFNPTATSGLILDPNNGGITKITLPLGSGGGPFRAVWRDDLDNSQSWIYQIIDGPCVQAQGGATAYATVEDGKVVAVTVPFNGGGFYLVPPTVTFRDGSGGTGATAYATMGCGGPTNLPSGAQIPTANQVFRVVVTNGGSGYSEISPPAVEFTPY